jgi:hypothetical protein
MFLAGALFLVSMVVFGVAIVHQAWPNRQNTYPVKTLALVLLCAAAAAVLVAVVTQLYVRSRLEEVADTIGVRRELAWAATLFVSGALSYCLFKTFSWRSSSRLTGSLGLSSMVAAYFLVPYAFTHGHTFDRFGSSLKCIAWDESGVRTYPRQQIDPLTGRPCILVTEENRDELAPFLGRADATPQPKEHGPFFTSRSYAEGPVPLGWYSRTEDGWIELWDLPGYHRETGQPLKLITPAIMRERERQRAGATRPSVGPTPPSGKTTDQVQALRQQYLGAYTAAAPHAGSSPRWALVAWSADGRFDPRTSTQITSAAGAAGLPPPQALFAEAFTLDGSADRLLRGDPNLIRQMKLPQLVDYVALARADERRLPDRGPNTFRAVDYAIQIQVVRVADLSTSGLVKVEEGAAGYDYEIAAERAREAAVAKLLPGLTATLKGFVK